MFFTNTSSFRSQPDGECKAMTNQALRSEVIKLYKSVRSKFSSLIWIVEKQIMGEKKFFFKNVIFLCINFSNQGTWYLLIGFSRHLFIIYINFFK